MVEGLSMSWNDVGMSEALRTILKLVDVENWTIFCIILN